MAVINQWILICKVKACFPCSVARLEWAFILRGLPISLLILQRSSSERCSGDRTIVRTTPIPSHRKYCGHATPLNNTKFVSHTVLLLNDVHCDTISRYQLLINFAFVHITSPQPFISPSTHFSSPLFLLFPIGNCSLGTAIPGAKSNVNAFHPAYATKIMMVANWDPTRNLIMVWDLMGSRL